MSVERYTSQHPNWPSYIAHLERVRLARWILEENGQPKTGLYFLGVEEAQRVIGHISLRKQQLVVPATEWSGGVEEPLLNQHNQPLYEMIVETFAVDEQYRRRGHGRALQLGALALTKETGCYQLRSWSSLDKPANYALKLSLGFAVHPATFLASNGKQISGAYFVKTV